MSDGHDQIPLLVHRDRVEKQLVEDFDAEESGQVEPGESQEGGQCGLANAVERGPRRRGEQLGQLGARVGPRPRRPAGNRERVDVELQEQLSVSTDKKANSSRKSWSSMANDPTRAAATRAGCGGAVQRVSWFTQSTTGTHRKLFERRQLPELGRHRRQRVLVQLRQAVRWEAREEGSTHRQELEGCKLANLTRQLGELVAVELRKKNVSSDEARSSGGSREAL